jgi:hypothetical protein
VRAWHERHGDGEFYGSAADKANRVDQGTPWTFRRQPAAESNWSFAGSYLRAAAGPSHIR